MNVFSNINYIVDRFQVKVKDNDLLKIDYHQQKKDFNRNWLFFDIGSTLVNEEKVYQSLILKISQLADKDYQEIYSMIINAYKQNLNGFNQVIKELGIAKPKWDSNLEVLYSDTIKTLKELHKYYKIGIIANQSLGCANRLDNLGILKYIDLLVYSEKEGYCKPDIKLFEIAIKKSGCNPKNAYMIGDRIDNDIIPAKKIKMKTIWIKQGFGKYWTIKKESEKPDIIINRLSELLNILKY